MKEIKSNEELKRYINNGLIEFGESIMCDFDVKVDANITIQGDFVCHGIECWDVACRDLNCHGIAARNISTRDIHAGNISCLSIRCRNLTCHDVIPLSIECENLSYYAVCVAYYDIVCTSITGRRINAKHLSLDGNVIVNSKQNA